MIYSRGRRYICTTCSRMRSSYQQVLANNSKKDLFCRFEYTHVVVVVVVVSIDHSTAVEKWSCSLFLCYVLSSPLCTTIPHTNKTRKCSVESRNRNSSAQTPKRRASDEMIPLPRTPQQQQQQSITCSYYMNYLLREQVLP